MSVQMNIERQPVIQRGDITIDLHCCTVLLELENISLYPKEFDVLLLTSIPVGCFRRSRFMKLFGRERDRV